MNFLFFKYYKLKLKNYIYRRILGKFKEDAKYFSAVNIETYAYCNRFCNFCFNNLRFPKRKRGIMKLETFDKIINDLSRIKYNKRISLHHYGEPLLDKRIIYLVDKIKKQIPSSYILIATNGDFLNEKLCKDLIYNGVDRLIITNYDDVEKPTLNEIASKYSSYIKLRSHEDLNKVDRAGYIFKKGITLQTPCLRPSSQLVIDWKGDVFLCCQDFYGEYIMGNVNEYNLLDIWNSKKFISYRNTLRSGKRSCVSICKHCDYSGRQAPVRY